MSLHDQFKLDLEDESTIDEESYEPLKQYEKALGRVSCTSNGL